MNKKLIDQYLDNLIEGYKLEQPHDHEPQSRKPYASDVKSHYKKHSIYNKHVNKNSEDYKRTKKMFDSYDKDSKHPEKYGIKVIKLKGKDVSYRGGIKNKLKNLFSRKKK